MARLHLLLLPRRPRRLAHAYAAIWTYAGSPLLAIGRRQRQGLELALRERLGAEVPVALGMTYGNPSIPQALAELDAAGVRRLVVLPLYPQYSCSTTAAAFDAVFEVLRGQRWQPELRTIGQYHDAPAYIAALAESVRAHWSANGRGAHLLISFHGVPQRYVLAGDPYYCQCLKTARLLTEALQLPADGVSVSFQSRFGKAPWAQPYTDTRIAELGRRSLRTLDVICPGFAADCLETLEEMALRYAADFRSAGGGEFRYISALNDDRSHLDLLAGLVAASLHGWLPAAEGEADRERRLARAAAQTGPFRGDTP